MARSLQVILWQFPVVNEGNNQKIWQIDNQNKIAVCYTAVHSVKTNCRYCKFRYSEYYLKSVTFFFFKLSEKASYHCCHNIHQCHRVKTRDLLRNSLSDVESSWNILNTRTWNLNSCNGLFYFRRKRWLTSVNSCYVINVRTSLLMIQ